MTRQQHRLSRRHCSHRRCNVCLPLRMSRLHCNSRMNTNHSHRTEPRSIHTPYQKSRLHCRRLDMPFHNAWTLCLQYVHPPRDPLNPLNSTFHYHRHSAPWTKAQHKKSCQPPHLTQIHKCAIAANKQKLLVFLAVDANQRYFPSCLSFLFPQVERCPISFILLPP